MKKPFFALITVVAVATAGFSMWKESQPLVANENEITINRTGERVYQGEIFTGEMVSYYPSGQKAESIEFVDGRRSGYSRKWFETGLLGSEIYYQNGRREGFARSWWINGNLRTEAFYIEGKKEGESWTWYRSGAKFKKGNFSQGQPVGIQQGWRENGDLFSNFEYRNGRVYGLNKANTCMGVEDETLSPEYYGNQS